jgi:hypothetical protein
MKFHPLENIKNIPVKQSWSLRHSAVISICNPAGGEAGVKGLKVFRESAARLQMASSSTYLTAFENVTERMMFTVFKKKQEWVILKTIKSKT